MRHIVKDLAKHPNILKQVNTLESLKNIIRSADTNIITENFYQDNYRDAYGKSQSRVKDALNLYYHSKCAYCEKLCKAEVEHYRPKKKYTVGDGTKGVLGYYWLCYEWSNLLPSCHDCNTSGGKGNKFPVLGKRAEAPKLRDDDSLPILGFSALEEMYINEIPILLNPEQDEPSEYLGVKIDPTLNGISLIGLDEKNQRGDGTIKICNLNRSDLQIARLRNIENFIDSVNGVFEMLIQGTLESDKLQSALKLQFEQFEQNSKNEKKEFSLVMKFIFESVKNFEEIIIPLVQSGLQQVLLQAFIRYK